MFLKHFLFIKSWIFKKITGQSVTSVGQVIASWILNILHCRSQCKFLYPSIHQSCSRLSLGTKWFSIFDVILKLTLYNTEILPVKKVIGGDLIRESQSNLYDLITGSEYCWCSLSKQNKNAMKQSLVTFLFIRHLFCVITSHVITLISFSSSLNDYWNILNNWFRHIF